MAITVQYDYAGRSGKWTTANDRTYVRKFTATTDTLETEAAVLSATGTPKRFAYYGPDDLGARCTDVQVTHEPTNELLWRGVANYSTHYPDPIQNQNDNPLLRPAIWRYRTTRGTRTEARDRRGNAYETTAGEPMLNPPPFIYATARYTITRNQEFFSSADADQWAATVNSDTWYGKGPGFVLCEGIQGGETYEGEYHFYVVTFILHTNYHGWQPVEVANKGHVYLDSSGEEQKSNTLVWLNADGEKWNADNDDEDDKYLDRYPYDEVSFNQFQL